MKKNIKRIIPLTLVFTLMISNVTIPSSGNLKLNSTVYAASAKSTGTSAPLAGCKAKGKLYKGSKYGNFKTLSAAAGVISAISGVSINTSTSIASNVYKALKAVGKGNIYYTRQQYATSTGELYYYKYTYYKDKNCKSRIGTSYSHLYSMWP